MYYLMLKTYLTLPGRVIPSFLPSLCAGYTTVKRLLKSVQSTKYFFKSLLDVKFCTKVH